MIVMLWRYGVMADFIRYALSHVSRGAGAGTLVLAMIKLTIVP